jgi:hypothetical protein
MAGVREEMSLTRRERVEMSWGQPRRKRTHLQDVAALVGDEEDVELLKRLVHESHIRCLDGRVLRVGRDKLGERCQQAVDA